MSTFTAPNPLIDDNNNAKAIEVAAMLGESVVDVKHCMDPTSGKVSRKTWGLAAAGLACVLASAASFAVGVNTAAKNKGGYDYWTQVAKKPAGAFRARQLSFGYDWAAFGGLAFGAGALAGALARSRRERRSPFYKIGTSPDVQQPVIGAPTESFPLVAPHGDDFVFNFGAGVSGDVLLGNQTIPLAELAASGQARPSSSIPGAFAMPIPMNARIRATVGQTSFLISGVVKPKEQARSAFAPLEGRAMGYFAGSVAAHLGLVLLLSQIPIEDTAASFDLASQEDVMTRLSQINTEDMPEEQKEVEQGGGGQDAAASTTMQLTGGMAGTDKTDRKDGHMRMIDRHIDPQLARIQAMEEARTAGVLGNVSFASGDAFASLDAMGNLASGADAFNVRGPIIGAEGEGYGTFGYGRSGFGVGCDSESCAGGNGTIGTNGYGRIGWGKYGRNGYAGPGGGGPGGRQHHADAPPPRVGEPTGSPNIDKAMIRRYIRRSIDKISYCYEKELLAKPGLDGTVSVQFFISPNGSVTSSVGAGMDATVANCVAGVVKEIEFPKPRDGGVQVNYPFTFRPSGT